MNTGSYVFAQMVKFLDEFVFLSIVKKYDGDKYVKHFSCWNQLLTLMFGQLTGKPSLRRFIIASAPIQKKFYSLGMGRNVTRSNLPKANNTRDYRIFEEFANHTVGVAQKMRIENIFKLGGKVYAFDSTTIDLCLSVYEWAHFRRAKGGIKVHTLFDLEAQVPTIFHITKAKLHDVNGMDAIPYEPGPSMCLTEHTTTSEDFTTLRRLAPSLSCVPRTLSSTNMSDGRDGCLRMSFRTPLSGLPFINPNMTTRRCFVESSTMMMNKTVSLCSLQMR